MKKIKTMLIATLVAVMAAGAVGCKRSDAANTDDTSFKKEEMYDFKGKVVKIGAPWNITPQPGKDAATDRFIERIKEYEQRWNFKIEWVEVGWDKYIEKYTSSIMAGAPVADILYIISRDAYPAFFKSGIAYPVSDLGVFDYTDPKWKGLVPVSTYKGKTYGLYEGGSPGGPGSGVFFNKAVFEREGLENPYDLVKADKWTWEKLVEIATKATKDTNGDGKADQWGLTGRFVEKNAMNSYGGEMIKQDSNGQFKFTMNDPKAIAGLTFYQDLAKKPIWADAGKDWDGAMKAFAKGNIAMNINDWWTTSYYGTAKMKDDWGFVPIPKANGMSDYYSYADEASYKFMAGTSKDPKDIAIIYKAIITDPELEEDAWKAPVEAVARDKETVQMFELYRNGKVKMNVNLYLGFGELKKIADGALNNITSGKATPQSAIEAIADQAQKAIDDALK
jgi:multiple sugar transport system substrate-binding protein